MCGVLTIRYQRGNSNTIIRCSFREGLRYTSYGVRFENSGVWSVISYYPLGHPIGMKIYVLCAEFIRDINIVQQHVGCKHLT